MCVTLNFQLYAIHLPEAEISLPSTIFDLLSHWKTLQRINVPELLEDEWFKKDYKPPEFDEVQSANLDDVEAVFMDSEVSETMHTQIIFTFSESKMRTMLYVS